MSVPKLRFKADDGSEFPEWEETRLGDEGCFYSGLSGKNKDDFGHGKGEYITYRNIFANTFAKPGILEKVSITFDEKQNNVKYGDVMFTQSSETFEELGLSSVWLYDSNPFLNSFCFGWRPNSSDRFIPEYLGYFFRSENVRRQIIYQGQGISRINLAASRMSNIILSIPCIAEQQKIADCLSTVDQIIEQTQAEVELWEKYKRGVMQMLFSQKVRFKADDGSEFPEWEEKMVQDVCTVTNGKGNTQDKQDDGKYVFFVRSEKIEHSNRYLYDKEAVITIGDGNIGKVYHYFKGRFNLHQRCYAMFDFKNVSGKYFYYYFSAHFLQRVQRLSAKGTVDSVRMNFIADMNIMIPCLAEQQKIAACLSAFDDVIDKTKKELDAYRELKKGLLQQMFV